MDIINSDRFLSKDVAAEQPWLIDDLIKTKSLVIVAAFPKSGKSFFTLALSQAVATGTSFLGKFAVPNPEPVLICNQEDSEGMTQDRYKMLALGSSIPTPAPGYMNFAVGSDLRVDDPRSLGDFKNSIAKMARIPRLFVFDVLTTFHSGNDTDQKQATTIVRAFNSIRDDFNACVMVVAHCRKEAGKGNVRIRGSGVFAGAMEVGILLEKTGSRVDVELENKFADTPKFSYELLKENGGIKLSELTDEIIWEREISELKREQEASEERLKDVLKDTRPTFGDAFTEIACSIINGFGRLL